MQYNTFLKHLKNLVEQTITYTPPNRQRDYHDNYDRYVDFPHVDDDQTYITHRSMEKTDIDEQDWGSDSSHAAGTPPHIKKSIATEQETEPAIKPEEKGAAAGGEEMPGMDDSTLGADVSAGGVPGMDVGMGAGMGTGMGEPLVKLTSTEVGRVYELKKIYSRLSSVESYLSRATDQSILELRKYVAQSIDLFEIVMANYDQFKENVDEIIIQYYEFLDVIYSSLRKFYKDIRS